MISVTMVAPFTYQVTVEDGPDERTYEVRLSQDYYMKLSGGAFTHEWVIVQAFHFLLEHESKDDILPAFDIADINRYFPEFEADIDARLNRRR